MTSDAGPATVHVLKLFKHQGVDEQPLVKCFLVKSIQLKIAAHAAGAGVEEQWRAFEAQFRGLALEEPESLLELVQTALERADYWLRGYFTAKAERIIY